MSCWADPEATWTSVVPSCWQSMGASWEGPRHWEATAEVRAMPRRSCPQVAGLFTCPQEVFAFVISGVQLPLPVHPAVACL